MLTPMPAGWTIVMSVIHNLPKIASVLHWTHDCTSQPRSITHTLATSIIMSRVLQRVWQAIQKHCRDVFEDFDKLLLETAAKAAGNVISCPACGEYSEFEGNNDDGIGFPQQPVQLFRCIKCLQASIAWARQVV